MHPILVYISANYLCFQNYFVLTNDFILKIGNFYYFNMNQNIKN